MGPTDRRRWLEGRAGVVRIVPGTGSKLPGYPSIAPSYRGFTTHSSPSKTLRSQGKMMV